jgi:hypothetical protein
VCQRAIEVFQMNMTEVSTSECPKIIFLTDIFSRVNFKFQYENILWLMTDQSR